MEQERLTLRATVAPAPLGRVPDTGDDGACLLPGGCIVEQLTTGQGRGGVCRIVLASCVWHGVADVHVRGHCAHLCACVNPQHARQQAEARSRRAGLWTVPGSV
jgi:hypothetical protein